MSEQELQQAFFQWLAQKLGVQSQEELQQAVQQMGQEGLQQAYQQFIQEMQQQQGVQAARWGAKLDYIRQLRGQCPEGTELRYYKSGGRVCKKCVAAKKGEKVDPVEEFKNSRGSKKKVKTEQAGGSFDWGTALSGFGKSLTQSTKENIPTNTSTSSNTTLNKTEQKEQEKKQEKSEKVNRIMNGLGKAASTLGSFLGGKSSNNTTDNSVTDNTASQETPAVDDNIDEVETPEVTDTAVETTETSATEDRKGGKIKTAQDGTKTKGNKTKVEEVAYSPFGYVDKQGKHHYYTDPATADSMFVNEWNGAGTEYLDAYPANAYKLLYKNGKSTLVPNRLHPFWKEMQWQQTRDIRPPYRYLTPNYLYD